MKNKIGEDISQKRNSRLMTDGRASDRKNEIVVANRRINDAHG
jgi:hypothetical protein